MGRLPKPIDGIISKVCKPERHGSNYRIHFRKNGVPVEAYRKDKEKAQELHQELTSKAALREEKKTLRLTSLSAEKLLQAELAFTILENEKVVGKESDANAKAIVEAAQKFSEAIKRQGPPISVSDAYVQFLAYREHKASLAAKTIQDYNRFLLKGFCCLTWKSERL